MPAPICVRDGCKRRIPPFAVAHLEIWCSRLCFQVANGYITPEEHARTLAVQARSAHDPDKVQQAQYRNRHRRKAA
jgi:hypothetical protein